MPNSNQRVGEFVLQERINRGTFGEVWKAHHHVWTDQIVAIKIPTDPQYLRNLQREGVAIHGLVHPNIVRAIGFDPYAETPYLAMEYVPGSSLRPMIQNKSLSIPDAVAIMRQVLAGLSHAHQNGIIHRDIKPENILVHERAFKEGFAADGAIKVTGFWFGRASRRTRRPDRSPIRRRWIRLRREKSPARSTTWRQKRAAAADSRRRVPISGACGVVRCTKC